MTAFVIACLALGLAAVSLYYCCKTRKYSDRAARLRMEAAQVRAETDRIRRSRGDG